MYELLNDACRAAIASVREVVVDCRRSIVLIPYDADYRITVSESRFKKTSGRQYHDQKK